MNWYPQVVSSLCVYQSSLLLGSEVDELPNLAKINKRRMS